MFYVTYWDFLINYYVKSFLFFREMVLNASKHG